MGMRRTLCLLSLTVALGAFGYEKCVDGLEVGPGPVRISCPKEDGWSFAVAGTRMADGICLLTIDLTRPSESAPPVFFSRL